MCRVNGCQEQHSKHYCKVCQHSDSSHFASSCTNSITVYHGTHKKNIKSIKQNGFRLSTKGRIGEGVYFTPNYKVAKKIAINRFGQHSWAVLECKIPSFNQKYKESQFQKNKMVQGAGGLLGGLELIAVNPIIGAVALVVGTIMAIDSLWQMHKEKEHNERIDNQRQQIKHYKVHGSWHDKIPYQFKGICVRRKMAKNIKIVKATKCDD